jgi:hypothetical protein
VIGVAGVAGLVVGGVTGGLTLAKKSTVGQHCGAAVGSTDSTACDQTGLAAVSSGRTLGWASTAALIAGGAGVAAAVVMFTTEPRGRQLSGGILAVGPDRAIAGIRGTF